MTPGWVSDSDLWVLMCHPNLNVIVLLIGCCRLESRALRGNAYYVVPNGINIIISFYVIVISL